MAKSEKTAIIAYIFDQLYDPATHTLRRSVVTSTDVQEAKEHCLEIGLVKNLKKNSNPFNFMKDIVRGKNARKSWPERVRQLGYTGKQVTGGGAIFEFVPLGQGEIDSLEEDFEPTEDTPVFDVESVSLSLASKSLGRRDESWLLQVAVNLRVIETHFAVGEMKQIDPVQVSHLQMDIKLRKVQIDSLYLARYLDNVDLLKSCIITVEAKQWGQRILTEQIARQAKAAFVQDDIDLVVPVALAGVLNEGIYVVEFNAVSRSDLDGLEKVTFHRDAMYNLRPPVPGI